MTKKNSLFIKIIYCLLLVFTITTSAKAEEKVILPDKKLIEDVPYVKQIGNFCATASATMLLKYYGAQVDQKLMAEHASKMSASNQGTYMSDLEIAIKKLGYQTRLLNLNTSDKPKSQVKSRKNIIDYALPILKKRIFEDKPVIIAGKDKFASSGHAILLVGYDDKKKVVYYMDPALRSAKIRNMSYNKFSLFWNVPFDNMFYHVALFVEPKEGTKRNPKLSKEEKRRHTLEDLSAWEKLIGELAQINAFKINQLKQTNIQKHLTLQGFPCTTIDFARQDLKKSAIKSKRHTLKNDLPVIENQICSKRPVIVCGKQNGFAHYLLLIGYDTTTNDLVYIEPLIDVKLAIANTKTISYQEFAKWWNAKWGKKFYQIAFLLND